MKKHLLKALALLLSLVMTVSVLPAAGLAVDDGSPALFVDGLPADGSYGVIFNANGFVMGFDLNDGKAPAKEVTVNTEGTGISALPYGTAVLKFIKTGDDYYMTVGGKYLTVKDLDADTKEKLVLTDAVEPGSKWRFIPDKGGAAGYYNILNVEYQYIDKNGNAQEVYLEEYTPKYGSSTFSPYSYKSSTPTLFQMKIAATEADEDGHVGDLIEAGGVPEDGRTYVIYSLAAKAVFGQPTGADVSAPALLPAAAVLNDDNSIDYENVADGGQIFTVHVTGEGADARYSFESGGKFLAMPENKIVDEGEGKTHIENDETLLMIEWPDEAEKQGYAQWTLTELSGGYVLYNVSARYKSSKCCVEYFNEVFSGWSFKSETPELFTMNFVPMADREGTGYVVNPAVEIKAPDAAIGVDCTVSFVIHDVSEPTEVQVRYFVTDRSDTAGEAKTAVPEIVVRDGSFTVPAADLENGKALNIEIIVTDVLGKSFSRTGVYEIRDEPLILAMFPAPNSATGEEKQPEIGVTFANVLENPSFEMLLDDRTVEGAVDGSRYVYTPAEPMADGRHSAQVTVTRSDGKSVSKRWNFFIGESGETLYYGQIHAHTAEYSDGVGTLEDAYEHAHTVDDLDFIIITDHSNYFDSTATATVSSYYNLGSLTKTAAGDVTKWEEARATAKAYNEQYEDLICAYGYEMTWSGGPGHTNTFNTYGVVSRNNAALNNKTGYAGMHLYNDMMVNAERGLDVDGNEAKTTRGDAEVTGVNATKYIPVDEAGEAVPVVSQFNHPGKTFGNFDNFAGCTARRDDVLNLVEVGNGEGKVGGSAYFPSYEEYDRCLSMGWHVAPTNNQDNHKGNWGDSNTCRNVILTDDFSEIGLYRALDARRVYSTEDQNLQIRYELEANGETYKLGDIAPIEEEDQPETVTVRLEISEPDRLDGIATVEVIGEAGMTLKKVEVNANEYKNALEIPNTSGFYYIRVVESDGDIAVTAPVWVKEAVPVTADLETSAAVAAQGEEETVTARLTNGSESEPLILTGYTVEAEGRVLEQRSDLSETVAAGAVKELKVPFTPSATDPSAVRSYEVSVTFNVIFKGKELVYTKTINETSYPPELMTYIGLDKGHDNFYVSGDYAGNDGNFIDICAQRGILCKYIDKGEMTKENLARFKAVLLTVPRVKGEGLPAIWTAEELEALADYAAKGGTILNFSKSDRYDPEINLFENGTEFGDGDGVMLYMPGSGNAVKAAVTADGLGKASVNISDAPTGIQGENLVFTLKTADEAGAFYLMMGTAYLSVSVAEDGTVKLVKSTAVAQGKPEEGSTEQPADYSAWNLVRTDEGFKLRPRDVEGVVLAEENSGFALVPESEAQNDCFQIFVKTGDDWTYSSENLSNMVNEAIGAQTRFVRGIVVDNEMKANEAYRIYFDGRELVGDHLFTEGIVPSTNGRYQWYNGTGITIDPCLRFTDVKHSGWYHNALDFVLAHGLMSGTGKTTFKPNATVTREMFVTVLWQLAGKPEPTIENPFSDVSQSNYSYRPVLWAYENGVTAGKPGGRFDRKGKVTRQEMAAFLYSFAKNKGMDLNGAADLSVYPDGDTVSKWARQKLQWAVDKGLINGVKSGGVVYLKPKNTATRAQMAVILMAFAKMTGEELPLSASTAVPLVSPYESTWVASYKANFTGSDYVPNYDNDVVMAEKESGFALATAEKLSGGGYLVCSGATFISNYDLKYGDPANQQYENYLLVCNILDFIKNGKFEGEITPIADVHNGEVGQEFTVEGIVTSNASDYDKDTAFFDCIYVQDETRGINCFPVSGYYFIGEKVRVHGGVTYYCGEIELNLSTDYNGSIQVISNDLQSVEPKAVSCAEAMSDENIGNLMKISGVITEIHETAGVIDMIYVDDGSGETALLFINGYIQKDSHALDGAAVGMNIEGVGIGSRDVDEASGGVDGQIGDDVDPSLFIKRLRVRSRDELLIWANELDTAELEAAIAEARAMDLSLYTEASAQAVTEALAAAEAVLADSGKDQRMVTEALNALRAALNALEPIPVDGFAAAVELAANDQVIIYHPAQKKALSTKLNGSKVEGVAVEPVAGLLEPVENVAVYTVEYPEGDTANFYLKMADGKYLTSAPTGNGMSFEETPNEYSLWYLEVKDADAKTVFVRSTNAAYNGNKNQALEFYNGYTTYGWKDNDNYIFQLFVKSAS